MVGTTGCSEPGRWWAPLGAQGPQMLGTKVLCWEHMKGRGMAKLACGRISSWAQVGCGHHPLQEGLCEVCLEHSSGWMGHDKAGMGHAKAWVGLSP